MIIEKRFIFYILSSLLVLFGILSFLNLKPEDYGIDLRGGQILEVRTNANVKEIIEKLKIKGEVFEEEKGVFLIKGFSGLDKVWEEIKSKDNLAERIRFEEISPSLSSELKRKGLTAVILVILAIAFYVSFSFRKIKTIIHSSILGLVVILTLFHDVIASVGPYILLVKKFGFSLDIKFITALLLVAGYSVSDTIVIFDRLRENILRFGKKDKEVFVKSIKEIYTRSIYTSLSTVLAILPLSLMVKTLTPFLLAIQVGIIIGTYSSICLATPLVYDMSRRKS
jgi:preprotein translocase SecF subunit